MPQITDMIFYKKKRMHLHNSVSPNALLDVYLQRVLCFFPLKSVCLASAFKPRAVHLKPVLSYHPQISLLSTAVVTYATDFQGPD